MGEAKRRKAEIEELKKSPRERKRYWRRLSKAKTEQVYHFRNEAARRACWPTADYNNSDKLTRAVKAGLIEQQFVQAIPVKICTPTVTEKSIPPRQPMPFPIVIGAKKEELAHFVAAMAQLAGGKGFRQPSSKAKNWQSTSLVEQLAIAFLGAEKNEFKHSERGEKKLEARNDAKIIIALDRLIEQFPVRAAQAKHHRMLNWFVAKIEEQYDIERENFQFIVKGRLDGRHPKFWHVGQRRRAAREEITREVA